MGLGTEIFCFVGLGFLVLGPKRPQPMLGHVTRAKVDSKRLSKPSNPNLLQSATRSHAHEEGNNRDSSQV